jgi:hypothetical protein
MRLTWSKIADCDATKNASRVLYVWARGGRVRYVGRAKNFGGAGGRYAFGYQYLVHLLLESRFTLYISQNLSPQQWAKVEDIERTLIKTFEKERQNLENKRRPEPRNKIRLSFGRPWKIDELTRR